MSNVYSLISLGPSFQKMTLHFLLHGSLRPTNLEKNLKPRTRTTVLQVPIFNSLHIGYFFHKFFVCWLFSKYFFSSKIDSSHYQSTGSWKISLTQRRNNFEQKSLIIFLWIWWIGQKILLVLKRTISLRQFNFSTLLYALVENQLFAPWETFCLVFCHLMIFFQNQLFSKNSFRNMIRVSNSLYPDQAWHFVMPDLGLNCKSYQKMTLGDKSLKLNHFRPNKKNTCVEGSLTW